jgi:rRNA maturation RNase YbeY
MEAEKQKIQFHYLSEPFHFPNRNKLKAFIVRLIKKEGKEIDHINFIFCDDDYLITINKQYLNHDTYTDIITFELSNKGAQLISDIYISVERVKENAKAFNTSFNNELYRVIFHGCLHLCGYKDKTKKEVYLMREKEVYYLQKYFVPRGTNQ